MCDQLECMLFLSYVIMKNDSICLNRFQDWTKSIFWPRFVVLNMTKKNKCYAIMLSLKMVHTLIPGRGNVGNSFPVLCRFYSVLAHARSSLGNSKIDFFQISGTITSYCKSLLADDMGAKHSCYNHVEQSSGKKSGKYKSYHRLLYLISGVSNFQLFGTKPVSLGVDFMLTCCCQV